MKFVIPQSRPMSQGAPETQLQSMRDDVIIAMLKGIAFSFIAHGRRIAFEQFRRAKKSRGAEVWAHLTSPTCRTAPTIPFPRS
jgi:hypothetical protein